MQLFLIFSFENNRKNMQSHLIKPEDGELFSDPDEKI